jgi:hypothetical protein
VILGIGKRPTSNAQRSPFTLKSTYGVIHHAIICPADHPASRQKLLSFECSLLRRAGGGRTSSVMRRRIMSLEKTKRRFWIVAILVVAVVAAAGSFVWSLSDPLHSRARRQWASQAITTIDSRVHDKAWLDGEIAKLKSAATSKPFQGGWVGDELLVAKNGEWIVCENVCSKEQTTSVRKDIFIGQGSDQRWYYSTFHFCVGKCVLQIESQPESLAQLVDGYWLVPFDGRPENCLNETWTGGPYGQDKLQAATALGK